MAKWTAADIPPQVGLSAIVTGTGGLGFEDALALARAGADVTLAGRNPGKGAEAIAKIRNEVPSAIIRFEQVDLASLASIESFGERMRCEGRSLDLLINNAGIMVPPQRQETSDGFELQFGTNYLGHFALTGHLMPLLRMSRKARVVTLSSVAARSGAIDLDDLNAKRSYRPMEVYSQSKLACLMFALELQQRCDALGWNIASMAAHPGVSRTDLLHNAPGRRSFIGMTRSLLWFLFQPASQGALPTLFAATSPKAEPGGYYGPDKLGETRGHPAEAAVPRQAADRAVSSRLWLVAEQLTGVSFPGIGAVQRGDQLRWA